MKTPGMNSQSGNIHERKVINNDLIHDASMYNFSGASDILEDFGENLLTLDSHVTRMLLCLYIPVFLLSFFANGLLLYVMCAYKKMRRVQNLFMINLALSDLGITIVCMPMSVGQVVYKSWVFGHFLCKLTPCLQGLCVATSILTLMTRSLDRYLAFRQNETISTVLTSRQTVGLIASTWIVSSFFVGPIFYVRALGVVELPPQRIAYCIEDWDDLHQKGAYSLVIFVFVYFIPCVVMAVCYCMVGKILWNANMFQKQNNMSYSSSAVVKGRTLVARMLISLAVVFMVSWMPYNIISIVLDLEGQTQDITLLEILPFSLWFAHAHSAVNPIMYWSMSKPCRQCLRQILKFWKKFFCGSMPATNAL